MFKLHIGELGGDGVGRIHIAERGGEHDIAPAQRHLGQNALRIGAFGHIFLKGDFHLVAVSFLKRHRPLMVLKGPAAVADRADIDKAGFDLVHACGK